jgi:hypothetical protein
MKSRDLVLMALLVGIGAVLHSVIPGFFFGMKPDMLLTMMFLGIILFPKTKHVFVLAITTGIISALTTTFPGGQLPNIIDKLITSLIFFGTLLLAKKIMRNYIFILILTFTGTIISGTIFLTSAFFIANLPAPFSALFLSVVLPTAGVNTIVMALIYKIFINVAKKANVLED